jgi:phage protein D
MTGQFAIVIGGNVADDLDAALMELEVEENIDMPGAFQLTLPITRSGTGDLDTISDARLAPLSNIAIVARADDGQDHCLIDGFVLSQTAHLDTGTAASEVKIWGQDATWLMNMTERTREWVDVTDGAVANTIFTEYGFQPADDNTEDDSASHTEDSHSLMQRASDAQFLRMLAQRNGKMFRVYCTDTPGQRTGWFARPSLDDDPAVVLTLNGPTGNDADAATIDSIDITWDVMRPSAVTARQALFTDSDPDGVGGTTDEDGLELLDDRPLAEFTGKAVTALLTAPVDDGGELMMRAQSLLRDAGWFVRCQGTTDADRLGSILRAGMVARLDAAGALHSGNYLVWSVRHRITAERHTMEFVLRRNAVGTLPSAGPLAGSLP